MPAHDSSKLPQKKGQSKEEKTDIVTHIIIYRPISSLLWKTDMYTGSLWAQRNVVKLGRKELLMMSWAVQKVPLQEAPPAVVCSCRLIMSLD